ncbi:hypothetical protein, partial [Vibrio barjaei]|uniref:hypothetical protein n=1 Tax=Vibrio barjaei TaxID=1676683 RepID=UPI0022839368
MFNSTTILNFLKPKKLQESISKATNQAKDYLSELIACLEIMALQSASNNALNSTQKDALNQFDGFGKVSNVFKEDHPQHQQLKDAIQAINPKYYESARRSILTSYYTPDFITDAMWRTVLRLGVMEGYALEPSSGSGLFIKNAPSNFKGKWKAIELDPIAAKVTELTTGVRTYNDRFENVKLNNTPLSLVIGNAPFGQIKARDKQFGSLNIHNYFCVRSLAELHEGGIMAMLVSSWVMDSKTTTHREKMAELGNLVAAVRLPSKAFADKGAAQVTTDILFMQRTATPEKNPSWINLEDIEPGFPINGFFAQNPQYIIGTAQKPTEMQRATCIV